MEVEKEELSFGKRTLKAVLNRLVYIVISFSIVTIIFLVMDWDFWLTAAAATTGTLAWVLASMFVSISSCLLSK